jgi:hypothetical protein
MTDHKTRLTALLAAHHVHVLKDHATGGLRVPPGSVSALLYALQPAPLAKGTPEHERVVRMITGAE